MLGVKDDSVARKGCVELFQERDYGLDGIILSISCATG